MTKRIVLGVVGLLIMLGLAVTMPVAKAETAGVEITLSASEVAALRQALDTLTAVLNLMKQNIQSLNLSPEQVQQLNITLQGMGTSLGVLSASLGSKALAATPPIEPVAESSLVMRSEPAAPKAMPQVMIKESTETVTVVTPEATAETVAIAETATVAETSGNWRDVAKVIWIVVVAGLVGWFLYSQVWRKKAVAQGAKTTPTTT